MSRADRYDTSMPPIRERHFNSREQLALVHDRIGYVAPSSAPSYW